MGKATIGIGRLMCRFGPHVVRVLSHAGYIKLIEGRKGPRRFEVLGTLPANPDYEELFKKWLIATRKENSE